MKFIKIIFAAIIVFSAVSINAQVLSNKPISPSISNSNAMLDGSSQFSTQAGVNNNIGKGIVIPSVDLTTFQFLLTFADGVTFPTYFDGMIVYNRATGNTLAGQGVVTAVTPGFYYFSNPNGATAGNITSGVWKPLGGGLTAEVDGVIGNEVLDATTNGGLVRAGSGTAAAPYTLGLVAGTSNGQVIKWDGTKWAPAADANTTYTASAPLNLSGTAFNLNGGTAGQVLTSTGATTAPTWQNNTNGTVTTFSSGTLTPLFTTSVATANTTPALSFALSTAGANTIFGNNTAATAAPNYFASSALPITGDVTGTLGTAKVTKIQGQAVSATAPTTGQVLSWNATTGWTPTTTTDATDWKLTGNAGTSPSANFVGTTDAQPLVFRVNNTRAGFISPGPNYNSFGFSALAVNTGSGNNAFGYYALGANTTGSSNNAFGNKALENNTTGGGNCAFGYFALNNNTTGGSNTAVGSSALQGSSATSTGSNNTALGYSAMFNNTGNNNIGIGFYALSGMTAAPTGGDYNVVVGNYALQKNTGSNNTGIGYEALVGMTTGSSNVAVGVGAGSGLSTGNYNTLIGASAGYSNNTTYGQQLLGGDYNTLIGYFASPSSSTVTGEITLGNSSFSAFARLTKGSSAWVFTSDRRLKHDIQPLSQGLSFVEKLKPVEFVYNNSEDGKKALGFVAQDVQSAMQQENMNANAYNLVPVIEQKNGTLGLSTDQLIPVLTKAIQEQQAIIESLTKRIEALEKK